uniref:Reverse transcriptase domain-containing protein n=1 Tax=Tanacetum cinerariifolium TaxID=118510 RepID=A0A6L2KCR6_TANCI|nr:hypothetical protein [Tanacetum cinerariifolium]
MNDLQFKLDNFQKNQQDFQEKFEQMQDDLLNQMRNFMQNLYDGPPGEDKEHKTTTDTELPSTEDIQPLPVQEPAQESNICHLLREECCIEVSEKQKMEDTMLAALDSKLLLINSNSQRLDKKDQEVKNVVERPIERGNHNIQSLQNFRVVHKSSISFNTYQISVIHAVAPVLSTKEPEHLLSIGYEHLSITPEKEFDEVTKSNADNLLPIPSECKVASEDKRECDLLISENSPVCDNSDTFSDSKIDDDISVYDDFKGIEYVEASLPDPEIVSIGEENSVEEENVVQQEEEVNFKDISQIQDVVLREKLLSIIRLISNIESLNDNSTPDGVFNSFESDNILLEKFSPEFETFCNHTEEMRSGNTTHADNSLPEYDSFCFEIEPDEERLINLVENDILDDSTNDPLLEETDLFLATNHSIPLDIENFYDSERDIRFLETLLIDDSILSHELSAYNFEDNPSIPRPPPEPSDAETDTGEEIPVVMNNKDEDVYYSFIFVIFDKMFSLLSAKSEDTIFDPGISD